MSDADLASSETDRPGMILLLIGFGGMLWTIIIMAVLWLLDVAGLLILPDGVKYVLMCIAAVPGICVAIGLRQAGTHPQHHTTPKPL